MATIVNLTQHAASAEQELAGVYNLTGDELDALKELLTFDALPTAAEIEQRAEALAELAVLSSHPDDEDGDTIPTAAMIGGAPFLMSALERALQARAVRPLYAFSQRQATEVERGGVKVKESIFKHLGFVEGFAAE